MKGKILIIALITALVFGMTLVSCDNGAPIEDPYKDKHSGNDIKSAPDYNTGSYTPPKVGDIEISTGDGGAEALLDTFDWDSLPEGYNEEAIREFFADNLGKILSGDFASISAGPPDWFDDEDEAFIAWLIEQLDIFGDLFDGDFEAEFGG